jgi:MFS family permease
MPFMEGVETVRQRHWLVFFGVLILYFFFTGFFTNTISLFVQPITTDLNILRGVFMLTITVNSVTNAILSTFYGAIEKKLGVRVIVVLSGISFVVSYLLYSWAGSILVLYLASVFFGAACAFGTTVTCSLLINSWFAKRQGSLIGFAMTVGGVGGIVGSPIINAWIESQGWRSAFLYMSAIAFAVTVVAILLIRNKPADCGLKPLWEATKSPAANPQPGEGESDAAPGIMLSEARKTLRFWCVLGITFLLGVLIYPVMSSIAAYTADLGYASSVGTVMSVLFFANIIFTTPLGFLFDKLGVRVVMVGSMAIFAISLVILSLPGLSLPLVYVAAAMTGFSLAVLQVPIPMITAEVFGKRDFGSIVGVVYTGLIVGIAVGTPVFNFGFDLLHSYQSMFLFCLPFIPVLLILLFVATRKGGFRESG